jgi:hypothetical protein
MRFVLPTASIQEGSEDKEQARRKMQAMRIQEDTLGGTMEDNYLSDILDVLRDIRELLERRDAEDNAFHSHVLEILYPDNSRK